MTFTKIGKLTAGGPATQRGSGPIWVATQDHRLTTFSASSGQQTMSLPLQPFDFPQGLALADDGSMWVSANSSVLHVATDCTVTTFAVNGQPNGRITLGPDQSAWVTELGRDRVARISADGKVSEVSLPAAPAVVQCGGRCPYGIATGSDGHLWITESQLASGDRVGRLSIEGDYQSWPLPEPGAALNDIVAGPDGNMWFGESRAPRLGRISTDGRITEVPVQLPLAAAGTEYLAAAAGLVWFAQATSPADASGPVTVGVATSSGVVHVFTAVGSSGPVAAIVPLATQQGTAVVDAITSEGDIWQGVGD